MVMFGRPFAAMLLMLVLSAGNIGLCAGWTAAAADRMACCVENTACPMHDSDSHASHSRHGVTQAQADACCATSEQRQSSQSSPTLTVTLSFAALRTATPLSVVLPAPVLRDAWRMAVPISTATVPKHVLHSVFLV
jgi:hypothetical protein